MTFFNIFSKKSEDESNKQLSKILIDNREKNSMVAAELASLKCPIEFQHLPVADYLIKDIAIERKTFQDLQSSIISKRIFSQLEEIKQYPKSLLLIEGFSEENFKNAILHANAIKGFLLSVSLEYKVPIIFTHNEKDTACYLFLLAKKSGTDKEISIRPSKILLSKEEQIQFILEGFPNIGPVKAKKLIEKFHTLKNIINAKENELEEILGKQTAEFIALIDHH